MHVCLMLNSGLDGIGWVSLNAPLLRALLYMLCTIRFDNTQVPENSLAVLVEGLHLDHCIPMVSAGKAAHQSRIQIDADVSWVLILRIWSVNIKVSKVQSCEMLLIQLREAEVPEARSARY